MSSACWFTGFSNKTNKKNCLGSSRKPVTRWLVDGQEQQMSFSVLNGKVNTSMVERATRQKNRRAARDHALLTRIEIFRDPSENETCGR